LTTLQKILIIAGPTASGKSARAVAEALARNGEVISVDSRQVYRGLDIGTEKISAEEMQGVPHHLIDILEPNQPYSAGEFAEDAARLIEEIAARGKLPILAGGTHFYFDALLSGIPRIPMNDALREELEQLSTEDLYAKVAAADPRRAAELDPRNRRRLVRALEIIAAKGAVPPRAPSGSGKYAVEWIMLDPDPALLRARLDAREESKFPRGLVEEVRRVRDRVGTARLNELGLEYRVVGEYLRGERTEASVLPTLSAQLAQYARRQRAWLRKLRDAYDTNSAAE
jgi:tRNA dimethylallyltransferase